MAFTTEQKSKLEQLTTAMLDALETLCDAGVPVTHSALAHLAEGSAAITTLLYPNGEPVAAIEETCVCGQPLHHGVLN